MTWQGCCGWICLDFCWEFGVVRTCWVERMLRLAMIWGRRWYMVLPVTAWYNFTSQVFSLWSVTNTKFPSSGLMWEQKETTDFTCGGTIFWLFMSEETYCSWHETEKGTPAVAVSHSVTELSSPAACVELLACAQSRGFSVAVTALCVEYVGVGAWSQGSGWELGNQMFRN